MPEANRPSHYPLGADLKLNAWAIAALALAQFGCYWLLSDVENGNAFAAALLLLPLALGSVVAAENYAVDKIAG